LFEISNNFFFLSFKKQKLNLNTDKKVLLR
jgi:hypothetical protein